MNQPYSGHGERVGANIRAALRALNITENRLASLAGVGQSTVNRLASGSVSDPKLGTLEKIEQAIGLQAGDLSRMTPSEVALSARFSEGAALRSSFPKSWQNILRQQDRARVLSAREHDPEAPEDGDEMVAVVDIRLSAGDGAPSLEFVESDRSIPYRKAWLDRRGAQASKCYVFKAAGPSMEPTIADGDLVLIDTARRRVSDGDIFAIVVAGVPKIKRLRIMADGGLSVESDNPKFPPELIPPELVGDSVVVVGRAISRSGDL